MKHGDRLGYPIFLLQRVMQQYTNKEIEFGILYDISSVLDKHIKIDYAVRFHSEFGLTDGEGVERLRSFIRRFTAITKEMTPSHRIDLLTDGLIHYARRKNSNIEKTLMERAKKADSILKSSIEEICTLEKDFGAKITEETINSWQSMEKTALTKSLNGKGIVLTVCKHRFIAHFSSSMFKNLKSNKMNIEDQEQEKSVTSDMEMISQDSLTDDTVMRTSDSEDGENMSQTSSELQSVGFDSVGVVVKANTNVCSHIGSVAGKKFLEQGSTYWDFLSYVNVNKEKNEENEWEMLRSAVQEKLNKAYKDSNVGGKHVEWSKVKKGVISACGFPAGLKAAPASSFGKENLLRILSDKVVISFAVADSSVSSINLSNPAEMARVLAASEANEEQIEEESSISIDASGGMELEFS
eukprot:gene20812-22855_t